MNATVRFFDRIFDTYIEKFINGDHSAKCSRWYGYYQLAGIILSINGLGGSQMS